MKEAETAPQQDNDKELLEDDLDIELEARFGLFEAIVTSQSQIIPDFSGRINLENIDTALSRDEGETRESFSRHKCKYNDKSAAALLTHEKSMHIEGFTCQMCEF